MEEREKKKRRLQRHLNLLGPKPLGVSWGKYGSWPNSAPFFLFVLANLLAAIPRPHYDRHEKAKYERMFVSRRFSSRKVLFPPTRVGTFSFQDHTRRDKEFCISIRSFFSLFFFFLLFFPLFMTYLPPPATRFSCCLPSHWQPSSFIEYINPPLASLVTRLLCWTAVHSFFLPSIYYYF